MCHEAGEEVVRPKCASNILRYFPGTFYNNTRCSCTCVWVEHVFHFGISLFTVPLEGMLALYSPTHSLPRIGWEIGLIIGFLFLFLSPLSSKDRQTEAWIANKRLYWMGNNAHIWTQWMGAGREEWGWKERMSPYCMSGIMSGTESPWQCSCPPLFPYKEADSVKVYDLGFKFR